MLTKSKFRQVVFEQGVTQYTRFNIRSILYFWKIVFKKKIVLSIKILITEKLNYSFEF